MNLDPCCKSWYPMPIKKTKQFRLDPLHLLRQEEYRRSNFKKQGIKGVILKIISFSTSFFEKIYSSLI